ncbi:hypothetical protein K3495_g6182 [Podosphaera aphanis]|nr:hypothetical protein K3495_g6182 [Podosphaera aphanis]
MRSRWTHALRNPVRNLVVIFTCWKVGLLIIAACSPGPGYDTSTSLNLNDDQRELPFLLRHLVGKLTRWDALYFTEIARRGYLFEQEWAFGWGLTRLIALCTAGLKSLRISDFQSIENLVAIVIAHVSHLLSVITLFYLTSILFHEEGPGFSFSTAVLQIISPAGIFLSAPYAESSCAFLSFAGYSLFAESFTVKGAAKREILVVISGIVFGIATTFRSNACLNGLLLLEEATRTFFNLRNGVQIATVRHLCATVLAGLLIAVGLLLPQYIAHHEFCNRELNIRRPWCFQSLPSIYKFVQSHYWNVGLFRYWKISNIPLFALSAPMITLVIASGTWALRSSSFQEIKAVKPEGDLIPRNKRLQIIQNLGVSQLLLAALTITTAHVQIITRISSSYPVWLWYTATQTRDRKGRYSRYIVRFMVIYGIVQAGLYSSFLPPA